MVISLRVICLVSLWLSLVVTPAAICRAAISVDALRVSLDTWLREIEFRSTYEVYEGTARSLDAAMSGEWTRRTKQRSGVFHKQGDAIHVSTNYPQSPKVVSREGGAEGVAYVPQDEVAANEINITFHDRPDNHSAAVAIVSRRPDEFEGVVIASRSMQMDSFGPMSLMGGVYRRPFDISSDVGLNANLERTIEHVDEEHIAVTIRGKDGMFDYQMRVVLWTFPAPPVVAEIQRRAFDGKGTEVELIVARALDFVDCPGGKVARIVRLAFPNGSLWDVTEWVSRDLGSESPSRDDFVLTIPEYARVSGILDPPPVGTPRVLDPLEYSVDDLMKPRNVQPIVAQRMPSFWSAPVFGSIFLVAAVLAAVGMLLLRRQRVRSR